MIRDEPYIEQAWYGWEDDPEGNEESVLTLWLYLEWPDGSLYYWGGPVHPWLCFDSASIIEAGQQAGLTDADADRLHNDLCRAALESWDEMIDTPEIAQRRWPDIEYGITVYPDSLTFDWQKPDFTKRIIESGRQA